MANIPDQDEIELEGLESEQVDILRPVVEKYNLFNQQTVTALNKGLTFSENFRADIKTLRLRPTDNTTFSLSGYIGKPAGLLIIGCANVDNPQYSFTAAPYVDWRWNGAGGINIRGIAGIAGTDRFDITFLVLGG